MESCEFVTAENFRLRTSEDKPDFGISLFCFEIKSSSISVNWLRLSFEWLNWIDDSLV